MCHSWFLGSFAVILMYLRAYQAKSNSTSDSQASKCLGRELRNVNLWVGMHKHLKAFILQNYAH